AQLDAALYGWAWVAHELERAEESSALFERLYRDHRGSKFWADAAYRLAKHASDSEDFDNASALLEELVEAEPERDILAHALYLQGRIAARRELWEEVEEPMA